MAAQIPYAQMVLWDCVTLNLKNTDGTETFKWYNRSITVLSKSNRAIKSIF